MKKCVFVKTEDTMLQHKYLSIISEKNVFGGSFVSEMLTTSLLLSRKYDNVVLQQLVSDVVNAYFLYQEHKYGGYLPMYNIKHLTKALLDFKLTGMEE